ncbi:MAG: DEAD/DEAH box helicase, partial [Lachnospiraceae bacterium]|nr:DEAD/DEAH box helicase [Lachnospiraceae bacterium]MDE6129863.1 DEAD/DEAH box helicase [Lachnospiraceae bacterium]
MKVDEEIGTKEQEQEDMGYENSGIDDRILRAVKEMGFENMTPIQKQAIPILMEGRDVIGQAQTGTGKTAAFGIPMLQRIDENDRSLQGIILCPTRELAIQAAEELRKFSKYMHGVKMVPIYGGQDISRQIKALKGGVQIIVGTPGRVMDHMRRHTIKLQNVKMVILDEADEMLDMGFREDMETILGEIENEHQTALFSATMPQAILDITNKYQKDAELIKVTKKELTIPLIKQYYFVVKNIYKEEVISRLLELHGFKRSII